MYKVLDYTYDSDDETAPPVYTSTNAVGRFKRTYTPGEGRAEHGAGLFLWSEIEPALDQAEGRHRVVWEVEPLSEVYSLRHDDILIASIFLSDREADAVGGAWRAWYSKIQHGRHGVELRTLKERWPDLTYTDLVDFEQIVLCDSFRYIRQIPLPWDADEEECDDS